MKTFTRTENGVTRKIETKEAMAEINHAMMAGKREVRTMNSGATQTHIEYKNGRVVDFAKVSEPQDTEAPTGNVVSVNGGEVHQKSAFVTPGRVYAMCRVSARTIYTETEAPLTCSLCIENVRRSNP